MKRLDDKYITLYLDQLASMRKHNPGRWMHEEPWRLALEEIRDRRAADLSADEREALRWAHGLATVLVAVAKERSE